MAYSTSNPPRLITGQFTGAGNIWSYRSTDAAGTVDGSGYFTNAHALGMKAGDTVLVYDTSTTLLAILDVKTVTASSAADLGSATTVGSTANAD